ncbi:hypothetical protein [Chitinophaga sp. YR573]|uniref:hypothetical protein n=1 Tax=Chitinophaga sp. YR573 TaxID=1881040 RepID=UPI000B7F9F31|nr:hypothetical protein [Chitinophaga sp. YR573]
MKPIIMNKEAFDLSLQKTDTSVMLHESIYSRQQFPVFNEYTVHIRFKPEHYETIKNIVASYNDPRHQGRVQQFIKVREDGIELYTDTVYNPYYTYYICISAFARYLENAIFFLLYSEENDEGDCRYVVDKYEIRDSLLDFNRDYTEYEESEDDYFKRLGL